MKIKILASLSFVLIAASFIWFSGSGGADAHAKPAPNAPDSTINWAKMDHAARMAYMKKVVLPTMRPLFTEFDSKKFATVRCSTCHGAGASDDSFKMPNPQIWKLPNSREGWSKADTSYMKFMQMTIKPKMAALLGMHPFDMKTKTGFGCGNCHTEQK
jgi:hypothetical protein